jgi:hypothetical protein
VGEFHLREREGKFRPFFPKTKKKKLTTKKTKNFKTSKSFSALLPRLDLRCLRRVLQEEGRSGGGDRLEMG